MDTTGTKFSAHDSEASFAIPILNRDYAKAGLWIMKETHYERSIECQENIIGVPYTWNSGTLVVIHCLKECGHTYQPHL